ncbi:PREDICTED: abhydrolase domain-containing protein 16A [Papilio xuthus]|uniref:Abhydrolase domain-containing protein 16A n=1 Tax=Papilio xuthus TaxID=66420 RepID=A0AAJ6ZUR0_PAPXU|nr:PREDICTED: abhydrolase domain-containing protein 16A [Papilio xuthus]
MLKLFLYSFFSPRLYRKHRDGPCEVIYKPNSMEKWGDLVIKTVNILTSLSYYASPFIGMYIYQKGFYTFEKLQTLTPVATGFAWVVVLSIIIRAIGRVTNPKYVGFLRIFINTTLDPESYMQSLRKYDFEFKYWPVSYSITASDPSWLEINPFSRCSHPELPTYKRIPLQLLAFVVVHTFGMRLIYPGTIALVVSSLWRFLLIGRSQLVETFGGLRAKLQTCDGNFLDTMFVDKREKTDRGNTLVVCSEGNSGFYEIGVMFSPIKAGYSVLGWNHPGFAESTGKPFPSQEQNAIDAVMQYAINILGFKVEDIVLFGWSIGGYTAAYAASTYPEVKALLLDATFDDILPIAQNQMPQSWAILVEEIIRTYADLNISEMLENYKGPICLVRRNNDEVICLRQGLIHTNRGNNLVKKLIETRYTNLTNEELLLVDKYVRLFGTHRALLEKRDIGESDRKILKLISKHMQELNGTHCIPLPDQQFKNILDSIIEA